MTRVGRDADILAKVSESEYYVLLPETDYFGALMFLRRAVDEVRREDSIQRVEERCPVLLSMGAATFPKDGEDFDELLHWARARIQEQRGSLVRRLHLDDLDPAAFWELADLLLAGLRAASRRARPSAPARATTASSSPPRSARRPARFGRDPRARGLLYVGGRGRRRPPRRSCRRSRPATPRPRGRPGRARLPARPARRTAPRRSAHPLVTEVYLDGDERFADHEFLLFLSEHSAYALLAGPGGRDASTPPTRRSSTRSSRSSRTLYDLQPL